MNNFIGKTSPGAGADYHFEEAKNKFTYQKDPAWVLGKAERNTLDIKAKYDHYHRVDTEVIWTTIEFSLQSRPIQTRQIYKEETLPRE